MEPDSRELETRNLKLESSLSGHRAAGNPHAQIQAQLVKLVADLVQRGVAEVADFQKLVAEVEARAEKPAETAPPEGKK